jgi:hypothetical protein
MKYQVGDIVKIKSFDWFRNGACIGFSTLMSKYCDAVLTIQSKNNAKTYCMKEDGGQFYWTDEMIEGLVRRIGEGTRSFAEGQKSHTKPSSELYKEYMEEIDKFGTASNPLDPKSNANCCITREKVDGLATKIDKELPSGNQNVWELPDGYQFVDENGNVINATTIALEKKKTEYPKTYEECVKILGLGVLNELTHNRHNIIYRIDLIVSLHKLLICRNAYWKVSGGEYAFDYDLDEVLYYIYTDEYGDIVKSDDMKGRNCMLCFPTEEAQEAFYENFRTELEICKEML